MIAWDIVLQLVEVKPMKKNFGGLKFGPKFGFWNFLKVALLVFLDIAQDCSLGQCLKSSGAGTSKKNFISILETSSMHWNFACFQWIAY